MIPTARVTKRTAIIWLLIALLLIPAFSEARITKIVIDPARSESPTFDGVSFGPVGQYEKLRGTAYGELDPSDPRNAADHRHPDGAATTPAARSSTRWTSSSSNRSIWARATIGCSLDFNNRGEMRVGRLNDVALTNNPTTAAEAGTGFVMNLGYSVVGNGWDFRRDERRRRVERSSVPVANNPIGSANPDITGPSYEYIVFDNATTMQQRAGLCRRRPWTSLRRRSPCARAWTTRRRRCPRAAGNIRRPEVRPSACCRTGTPFQQSHIYEFTYTAKNPVVAASGLAATRDFVSFLRHAASDDVGSPNPLAGDVQYTLQLFHLAALAYLERFPDARVQRGRAAAGVSSTAS